MLAGPEAPAEWKGNLNVAYTLGPEFNDTDMYIRMDVHGGRTERTTYNTIGILRGAEEPGT